MEFIYQKRGRAPSVIVLARGKRPLKLMLPGDGQFLTESESDAWRGAACQQST